MIAHLADAWPIAIIATILRIARPVRRPRPPRYPHVPAGVDLEAFLATVQGIESDRRQRSRS